MAKHGDSARALAFIVERPVPEPGLAAALREDLAEVLQLLRLRATVKGDAAEVARAIAGHRGQSLVLFSDVPGLPPDCAEGALELCDEADVVLGPCADGSVYLLAFAEGLEATEIEAVIRAATPADGLGPCVRLLEESGLEVAALPPWFRAANPKDLSFAESLMRLSLMREEGELDFMADRLRLWFEKRP